MTARTFKNADEAASELLRKGFKKTDSDPDYPFEIVWSNGIGMKARFLERPAPELRRCWRETLSYCGREE